MSDSVSSDAIIVGGGLHGTSTALYLRRMGLSVNVIEKHFPGPVSYTHLTLPTKA